jgi:hypothetical protein
MGYDKRIVVFIDILGFKNAIEKTNSSIEEYDRILKTLTDLKDFFLKPKDQYDIDSEKYLDGDTQIIQVTDSLVISRLYTEKGGVYNMLLDCAFAIHILIDNGFLCRGAIKIGNLHHHGTTIFGKAFIDAYESEAKEQFPIVKFDRELFEIINEFPGQANKGNESWEQEFVKKNCKESENGEFYLDYFTDYDDRFGAGEGTASMHYYNLRKIIGSRVNTSNTSRKISNCRVKK